MPVKVILWPLSEADEPGPFIETALGLAQRFQAHLSVLYVLRNPRNLLPYASLGLTKHMREAVLEAAQQNAGAQATQARELLDKYSAGIGIPIVPRRPATAGVSASWQESTGQEDSILSLQGRLSDLILLPGPIPVSPPPAFVEAALKSTGRPVMIVPPKPAAVIGSHIGIGWNGSAEAARAVGAAMAYLTTAESVTIFTLSTEFKPMRDFQANGRSAVYAQNGMAATSHPLATKVALDTLQQGGNAVDAAVAAALMLPLCEPSATGLFGDAFALIKPAGDERIIGINGSGPAPAALSAAAMRGDGLATVPTKDARAVTLPGAVAAFERMLHDHGLLGWAEVAAPAIHYADAGVPVAPRVAFDWAAFAPELRGAARRHYLIDDAAPRPGQLFRAPGQAEVLRRISAEGAAGFYQGEVVADLIESLQALGGCHSLADMAGVGAEWVQPISADYRGLELVELPPNGQGITALLMAKILAQFDLAALAPFGAERAHIEAEAAKLAYDARNRFVADPRHVPDPDGIVAHLLSDRTAAALAGLIDPDRAMPDPQPLTEAVHRDTVYLTVVDRERCAVSLIFSIFHGFGSGLASERFGLLFQNRGAGFSLVEGHPNEAAGGKRPLHTIIPAMLRRNGRLLMPFGVMGGPYQPTGHVRILTNLVDYGMDLQAALDAPRSFAWTDGLELETGYSPETAEQLAAMGHRVQRCQSPHGGSQAIWIDADAGVLIGASDPRKDGCALGY